MTEPLHVVVAGCGRVGSGLAAALDAQGHSVAIIDKAEKSFAKLPEGFGGTRVLGLAFDRDTLAAAGVERAGAFAAVTSGDNSNILAARIARETYEIASVVARIYDPRRAAIYQRLGIATVATVAWTTDQVLRRVLGTTATNWTDQSGRVSLVERALPESWAGRPLKAFLSADGYRLVALSRGGTTQLATDSLVGQDGDVLHLIAETARLGAMTDTFEHGPEH